MISIFKPYEDPQIQMPRAHVHENHKIVRLRCDPKMSLTIFLAWYLPQLTYSSNPQEIRLYQQHATFMRIAWQNSTKIASTTRQKTSQWANPTPPDTRNSTLYIEPRSYFNGLALPTKAMMILLSASIREPLVSTTTYWAPMKRSREPLEESHWAWTPMGIKRPMALYFW